MIKFNHPNCQNNLTLTINIILSWQVCDPAYGIIGDSTQYRQDEQSPAPESTSSVTSTDQPPSTEYEKPKRWSLPEDKLWGIGIRGVVIAILAFGVLYILASSLDASRICAEVCPKGSNSTLCTSNVQSLCAVQSMSGLMKFIVFLLLVAAIIGIELLFDKIEQSGNARRNWMQCTFAWNLVPKELWFLIACTCMKYLVSIWSIKHSVY